MFLFWYCRVTHLEKSKQEVRPSKVDKCDACEDILVITLVVVKFWSEYEVHSIEEIEAENYISNTWKAENRSFVFYTEKCHRDSDSEKVYEEAYEVDKNQGLKRWTPMRET